MEPDLEARLMQALLHVRRASAMLGEQMEVSMMELSAMRYLQSNRQDSPANVFAQDLARELHASKAAVSQMLSSLEKRGYVTRAFNPENRRKIMLMLTESGQRVLAETNARSAALMQAVTHELGEENADALTGLLERFTGIIERRMAALFT